MPEIPRWLLRAHSGCHRHPLLLLCHITIAEVFETWFSLERARQFDGKSDRHIHKPYFRQAVRGRCMRPRQMESDLLAIRQKQSVM